MGKKFQKKKKTNQLEIVPMNENLPLPPKRSSDDVIPKRVNLILINCKCTYLSLFNFRKNG